METEDIEMRFGVMAVKMGFVSPNHVIDALEIQVKEDLATGKHRPVGAILLDQGLLTELQMQEVVRELVKYH